MPVQSKPSGMRRVMRRISMGLIAYQNLTRKHERELKMSIVEGTVICRTLKPDDLIPAFCEELQKHCAKTPRIVRECESYLEDDPELDNTEPEIINELVNDLIDELNNIAPDNMYFGNLEGDGSDFGFWYIPDDDL